MAETRWGRGSRLGLAALLGAAGVLHLVAPDPYARIVPDWAGDPDVIVAVSGVAELAVAALLAVRRTSQAGGWAAAVLFVVVFPANIQMAVDDPSPVALARLPLQVPLVLWALAVARPGRRALGGRALRRSA